MRGHALSVNIIPHLDLFGHASDLPCPFESVRNQAEVKIDSIVVHEISAWCSSFGGSDANTQRASPPGY
ncbi:hypothetical protein OUZ56_012920 [Daphnia magna]|uniref:Uncharacterized protein n=1 Tax=Daphnia magna TaxID=35525 RepID=A0ABQ9Z4F0_9CRUS|nr:hypothetical protein OUZ56_012920 [Daphnia magna]